MFAASIMGPSGPVSEADGSVDVCVNVTNANNIPNGGVEIKVVVATAQSTATCKHSETHTTKHNLNHSNLCFHTSSADDYELQEQPLTFTPGITSRCVPIRLVQDNLVEGNVPETMLVRIFVTDQLIQTDEQSDIVTIMIEDSDSK